jgi:lysozyme
VSVYGPDVSHYQGKINWDALVASGEGFAIAKASQGRFVDSTFAANRAGSLHLPVRGAYHFGDFGTDPTAQAHLFTRTVGPIHAGDMLWLDAEDTAAPKGAATVDWIRHFLATVQIDTGLPASRVGIYTGAWWWNPHTNGSAEFADHPLWVSGYGAKVAIPTGYPSALLWQYTNKARVKGIAGGCDRSVYAGTLAQLRARAGNPIAPPLVTPPPVVAPVIVPAKPTKGQRVFTTGVDFPDKGEIHPGDGPGRFIQEVQHYLHLDPNGIYNSETQRAVKVRKAKALGRYGFGPVIDARLYRALVGHA